MRTLRDELYGIGLRHNTYAQIFDNTLWIHIGVYDSRPSRHDNSEPAQAVVLVYFPLSRYVLFAGPKGAYEWTTAVLSATFNAQECAESKLTGRKYVGYVRGCWLQRTHLPRRSTLQQHSLAGGHSVIPWFAREIRATAEGEQGAKSARYVSPHGEAREEQRGESSR